MDPDRQRYLLAGVRAMFVPGDTLSDDVTVVEVREGADEATILIRFEKDPQLYGLPIPFRDTAHEFFYKRLSRFLAPKPSGRLHRTS